MPGTQGTAHLLRVEGVNLGAVLDDTNDISVRRGAGLLLRRAVRDLEKYLAKRVPVLVPISMGASVGLFEVRTADSDALVGDAARYLSDHAQYRHLTFVVDCVPLSEGFRASLERVTAQNRLRQFQQPTLAIPDSGDAGLWCAVDQIRPGRAKHAFKDYEVASLSTRVRRDYGREARQAFYSEELGKAPPCGFTEDLQSLAAPNGTTSFGNLDGKMAVIYLDGNGFGQIQRQCRSAAELRAFDQAVQSYRREFLRALIDAAGSDQPGFRRDDQIRLETLLWGGDEILLVVPAWKGIETLERFYWISCDWEVTVSSIPTPGEASQEPVPTQEALTHAGGIVFCRSNTPIAQVRKAAEELADGVKRWKKAQEEDEEERRNNSPGQAAHEDSSKQLAAARHRGNRFGYLVLESIDYPTEELDEFRKLRYGEAAKVLEPLAPFAIAATAPWHEGSRFIASAMARWPRGALYDVAVQWVSFRKQGSEAARQAFEARLARLWEVSGKDLHAELCDYAFRFLAPDADYRNDHDHPGWLHLAELWEYLAPQPQLRRGKAS